MKKQLRRILAAAVALMVAVIALALPASAETEYTPLTLGSDTKVPLVKEWEWPELDNIPNVMFQFHMQSDRQAPEGEKPGPLPNTFNLMLGMKSGSKNTEKGWWERRGEFSLSGMTFTEPGVFSFLVQEGKSAVINDLNDRPLFNSYDTTFDTTKYKLKVEIGVAHDGKTLKLNAIWVEKEGAPGEKMDTFIFHNVSQKPTADLTVKNTVSGEDTTGTFDFTIDKLEGAEGQYTVTTPAGDKTITVAADGTVTADAISLQNGETFVIKGLPVGTKYTITEKDPGTEYVVTVGGTETMTAAGKLEEDGITVEFLNTLQQTAPTGILLDVAPFALLAAILAATGILLAKKSRR